MGKRLADLPAEFTSIPEAACLKIAAKRYRGPQKRKQERDRSHRVCYLICDWILKEHPDLRQGPT